MPDTEPDTGPTTDDQTTDDTDATDQPDTGSDLAAEVEKWKAQARKHENRAKANSAAAKELEKLRSESMSEQERAVAEARKEAAAEAARAFGARLVDAEVRAAAATRPVDVDALLDGLDRSRFLSDDGDPDTDAIAAWVDRIAPKVADTQEPTGPQVVDLGQGARGQVPALNSTQLERDLRSKLGIG